MKWTFHLSGTAFAVALLAFVACDSSVEDEPEQLVVALEPNSNNVLSCTLTWTTEQVATSVVEFGAGDEPTHFVENDGLPTRDHEVLVVGLKPDSEYQLRAVSVTGEGVELVSAPLVFETGQQPFVDLVTEITVHDEERTEPGWTLLSLRSTENDLGVNAVIFDEAGDVVWYFRRLGYSEGWSMDARLTDSGQITLGGAVPEDWTPIVLNQASRVVWSGPVQPGIGTEGAMHHTFERLDDGNYATLMFGFEDGFLFDLIYEFDPDGEPVWIWSSHEHLFTDDDFGKWCNALTREPDNSAVYLNCNRDKSFHKIDRSSGEVLWSLGLDLDFEPDPDSEFPWFYTSHDPELQDNGNFLIYDNGDPGHAFTRVVEYALDDEQMTSRIVWEYPGELVDDSWYHSTWGDADRMPNGNTLITTSSLYAAEGTNRILEVTPEGETVWEMLLSSATGDEEIRYGAYRSERIPPLIQPL